MNRLMQPETGATTPKLLALFGRSGTGKTHLAHGLVNHWNTHHGPESSDYLTAADFYRGLLDGIKRDTTADFHRALRDHELLAIDDLHQLPSDDYVSRELRFTLDAYEENGGTIIVTSLRPANTLANISPDLRSRLSAGSVAAARTARWGRTHPYHSPGIRIARPSTLRTSRRQSCQQRRRHGERTVRCRFRTLRIDERRPQRSIAIRPPASTSRNHRRRRPPLPPAPKAAKKPIPPPIDRHCPRSRHLPRPRIGRAPATNKSAVLSAAAITPPSSTITAKSNANAPTTQPSKRRSKS